MKRCIFLLAVVLLFVSIAGCEPTPRVVLLKPEPLDKSGVTNTLTVGNNSYIPINYPNRPSDNPMVILNALNKFEKDNPDLLVIEWCIEREKRGYGVAPHTFGLWIHHSPKAKPPQ